MTDHVYRAPHIYGPQESIHDWMPQYDWAIDFEAVVDWEWTVEPWTFGPASTIGISGVSWTLACGAWALGTSETPIPGAPRNSRDFTLRIAPTGALLDA